MRGFIPGVAMLLVLSSAAAGCTSEEAGEKGNTPLSSAELSDALLTGKHSGVNVSPQQGALLEDVDVVTAADPTCQPLADLKSATPKRPPTGTAWAALQAGDGPAGGSVVLASYARDEAKAQMYELKAALAACKDFSATSQRGWSERSILVSLPSVEAGDESVSFSATSDEAPGKRQTMTIVRTGGSLAVYLTPSDGKQPPASLMERQHEELEAAG